MRASRGSVLIAAVLLAAAPVHATSQVIRGEVVLQGAGTPVPGAQVSLLDSLLETVALTRTDAAGAFSFERLTPGPYLVQAGMEGVQTPLSEPLRVGAADSLQLRLELPSPVVVLAMTCGAAEDANTTVLVGTVHDRDSGVALPHAPLVLSGIDYEAHATSDAAGNYRFCAAPVGAALTLATTIWGRTARTQLTPSAAPVNRADFAVVLGAVQFSIDVTSRRRLPGTSAGLVVTLRDAATGTPLSGAAAALGDMAVPLPASDGGVVHFRNAPPGEQELTVDQVGYGRRSMIVTLTPGEELHAEVSVPAQPIALDPIGVRSDPASERRSPRTAATRVDVMTGAEMAFAESRGAAAVDLVRQRFPGLLVSEGAYSTPDDQNLANIVCIESIRRMGRLQPPEGAREPFCDMLVVIYDGVPTFRAGEFLRNLSARELESVEYLGPLDAGGRYGVRAGQTGALLLWSRGRGPYRSPSRNSDPSGS